MAKPEPTCVEGMFTAEDELELMVQNSPNCPNCESGPDAHEARRGDAAPRGDGIYCVECGTFVCPLETVR